MIPLVKKKVMHCSTKAQYLVIPGAMTTMIGGEGLFNDVAMCLSVQDSNNICHLETLCRQRPAVLAH
jgi:hypothetical protein